ncbi:hypothetical protein FJU08_01240 [Martelella alba]|uniref:Peptidase S24/S26A/S26B/S26C domain-containing protein n=1 Tax=Martelella alba TaxID=2590451 RepID=A0A506UIT9_9HYPH|nr:hypothetical protein [Martelella alba]TPW33218.1 hypothetical protein FJU08_01240 [Martelella alba]
MMTELRDKQLAWLNHITEATGLTITEIARAAGLHPSTLTRFRYADKSGHSLTSSTVHKIEMATRVAAYDTGRPKISALLQPEASPFLPSDDGNPLELALRTIAGRSQSVTLWKLETDSLSAIGYPRNMIVAVDADATPRNGDAVCAQRPGFRRQTQDLIFRVYRAPYLLSASDRTAPEAPEIIDNETTLIIGVIVGGFTLRDRN